MTTLYQFGLNLKTIQALHSVFSKYTNLQTVLIYGSRAKGNFKDGSDIDLTLIAPEFELSNLLKIENDIEELMLPYKVDLSLFHKIENPNLVDHINRIGMIFYKSA